MNNSFFKVIVLVCVLICQFQVVSAEQKNTGDTNFETSNQSVNERKSNLLFEQGNGYEQGGYDQSAIYPTEVNWNRQSRFNGPEIPINKWKFNFNNNIDFNGTIGNDGTIYATGQWFSNAADEGIIPVKFYAITSSGEKKWEVDLNASYSAIGHDGTIYTSACLARSKNCGIYAINPDSGEIMWSYTIDDQSSRQLIIGKDGSIYLLSPYYHFFTTELVIYKINPDGSEQWVKKLPQEYVKFFPLISKDGYLYIVKCNDSYTIIDKLNTDSGIIEPFYIFDKETSVEDLKIADNGTIYVGSNEMLYAISKTGEKKWETSIQSGAKYLAISKDGTIYAKGLTNNPSLHAISPNGLKKWSISKDYMIRNAPIIGEDGVVYDGAEERNETYERYIYAINPVNGKEIWQTEKHTAAHGTNLLLGDGVLYYTSYNILYAIGHEKKNAPINFIDVNLETFVREIISKPTGNIFAKDIENIEELDIGPEQINSLEGLQHFTNLKSLYVYGNNIEDISPLRELNKLEILDISNNLVKNLDPIQGLANLKFLDISNNEIKNITSINSLSNLLSLDISSNYIQDIGPVKTLIKLTNLFSRHNRIGEGIEGTARTNNTNIQTKPLEPLKYLSELKVLDVNDNVINSLVGLENLENLEELYLSNNQVSSISELNQLTRINKVDVSNNLIEAVDTFNNNNIKELDLSGNNIVKVESLANLNQLEFLNVETNPVVDLKTLSKSQSIIDVTTDNPADNPILDQTEYVEWDYQYIKDQYKVWNIQLSSNVDTLSLKNAHVFVKDSNGNVVRTELEYIEESKNILLYPPELGYNVEETYTIYIKDLYSIAGKKLEKPIKMSFKLSLDNMLSGDNSILMNYNQNISVAAAPPAYLLVTGVLTASDVIKTTNNLIKIIEKREFFNKFLNIKNINSGSAKVLMSLIEKNNTYPEYQRCITYPAYFGGCLSKLGQSNVTLKSFEQSAILEDLHKEVLSIWSQVHDPKVLALPTFIFNTTRNIYSVTKENINKYQNGRKNESFKYSLGLWGSPLKITGKNTLYVGATGDYLATGKGKFLGKSYKNFQLTRFTDTLWASYNTDIATVTQDGKVKALKKGKVTIAAMYNGKIAKFNITVR